MNDASETRLAKKLFPPAWATWAMLNDADRFEPELKCGVGRAEWHRYTVHLRFEREHFNEVSDWLKTCLTMFGLEQGQLPWTPQTDAAPALLATSGKRPSAIDASKHVVPSIVKVGGGSRLRAYVTARPYYAFCGGISLQLNSYQVLEITSDSNDPFKVEKGWSQFAVPSNRPRAAFNSSTSRSR